MGPGLDVQQLQAVSVLDGQSPAVHGALGVGSRKGKQRLSDFSTKCISFLFFHFFLKTDRSKQEIRKITSAAPGNEWSLATAGQPLRASSKSLLPTSIWTPAGTPNSLCLTALRRVSAHWAQRCRHGGAQWSLKSLLRGPDPHILAPSPSQGCLLLVCYAEQLWAGTQHLQEAGRLPLGDTELSQG